MEGVSFPYVLDEFMILFYQNFASKQMYGQVYNIL